MAQPAAGLTDQLADRLREAEALLAISTTVNSTLDVGEALRRICREVAILLGADTAAAYRHDAASDQLQPVAGYHVPKHLLDVLLRAALPLREQGFYAPIWQERRPVLSNDVSADPRFGHELFRRFHHQSGLLLPLVLDDHVAGAFYLVWWTARRELTAREQELIEHIVEQVAVLLRNAGRFERAERERLQLEVMYELAGRLAAVQDTDQLLSLLVNEAAGLLGTEAGGLRLLDGDVLVVRARTDSAAEIMPRPRLAVGSGLSGRVVARGEPVAVEDLEQDGRLDPEDGQALLGHGFRSYLGVPLRLHGRVIGALQVFARSRRPFTADDVALLSALADQASLAIHKARLLRAAEDARAESHARAQEVTRLYEVTRELTSTLDVERILSRIVAKTVDLLASDAAGIYTYDDARGGLTFRSGLNLDPRLVRDLVLEPGEGVAGLAYAEQRPVWTRDRLADAAIAYTPAAGELIEAVAPRAYLAVPIVIRGDVFGVLVDYFFEPHDFSPKEVQLLSTLADHAAIAMDNARTYEEMRTQRIRLTQILDSTSDGIVVVGPGGSIEAANPRAGELLGLGDTPLVGRDLDELAAGREAADPDDEPTLATLRALATEPEREVEGDLELRSGGRILHWVARPTRNAAGSAVGVTLTFRDVTEEREVSRMKSEFVTFVTHQLRTPLAGIKWMLELAGQEPDVPADARSYVKDAGDAAQRLINLVNDLLDVSRLERGKLAIARQAFRLGVVTQALRDEVDALVEAKGQHVSIEGDGEVPPVSADPQLVRQALLKLMSNAIEYTPPGGRIAIRIAREGRFARWSITDTGIGVPEASRARLFEKFYRADNVAAVETEGTGLGLYIVRLIMEQLGGRIWYEPAPGGGSTFLITLPMAA